MLIPRQNIKVSSNKFLLNFYLNLVSHYSMQLEYNLSPTDLPANAIIHDLAGLVNMDSKNIKVKELGVDVIKAQQVALMKLNVDNTSSIQEDCAQVMLAAVINYFVHHIRMTNISFHIQM